MQTDLSRWLQPHPIIHFVLFLHAWLPQSLVITNCWFGSTLKKVPNIRYGCIFWPFLTPPPSDCKITQSLPNGIMTLLLMLIAICQFLLPPRLRSYVWPAPKEKESCSRDPKGCTMWHVTWIRHAFRVGELWANTDTLSLLNRDGRILTLVP